MSIRPVAIVQESVCAVRRMRRDVPPVLKVWKYKILDYSGDDSCGMVVMVW